MPKQNIPEINKRYKPNEKEQELREWVYLRKQQMEDAPERQRAEKVWDAGEKQWDQFRKERDEFDWQSDYFVPLTTSIVESVLADQIEQLPSPFLIPRGSEDIYRVKVMQNVYEYAWSVANGDDEMMKTMRGNLIHGTAIAQEYYLKDKRTVMDITGLSKKKNKKKQRAFEGKEREVLEYDDVMMEWVDPRMVLVDENATDFNRGSKKARDCIRRYVMNYRDAEAFFKGDPVWDHMNNFRFVKPGGDTDYYQFYKPPEGSDKSEDVEVLWYWARVPEDLLVIMINDVVIRMGPNIYKHKQLPFAKVVDVERLGFFYGKGEPELLQSIQEESNTLRRMMMDRNHLDIDKTFVGNQTTNLDEEDLVARPHGLLQVDDPASFKALEYGDIPLSVERTMRAIGEDKIGVTGVDDRFQSVQKAPSTATEAAILKESTLKRIRMKMRNFERRFLVDIGRMRISNILQFYTQPKLEEIIGEKGTADFKAEVGRIARQGLLEIRDGKPMKKQYRQITTEGKKLSFDERGKVQQKKEPGFHFFEARPEFFLPKNTLGYDIRFEAGPSLPVSKPLMQQRMLETYDRMAPALAAGTTNYDEEKVIDELVIKPSELNPEDLKRQEAVEEQNIEENRVALAVDLASQENEMALQGKPIPEIGTPYAPPPHTQVHIEFLSSDQMKSAPQDQYDKLLKHTVGEIEAITQRSKGSGVSPEGAAALEGAPGGPVVPGLVQGGGDVPTGRALGNG